MNILAVGDIVGERTVAYLREHLWRYRRENSIDLVVANGENASDILGIDAQTAKELLGCGVDVITGGNHTLRKRELYPLLESSGCVLRPSNYPPTVPGSGYTLATAAGYRVLVINIQGTVGMEPLDSPFACVERILDREAGKFDLSALDIHAEATAEKLAMARYFDGKITLIFGTHTHVQTADAQILPGGTAYITDLGMSGPTDGVLGVKSACAITKLMAKMPVRFEVADGPIQICGALFSVDPQAKRALSVHRVVF